VSQNPQEVVARVGRIFGEGFEVSEGQVIPNLTDLAVRANEGRKLELAMLFVDIRSSTFLVDAVTRTTAAKMYKSYLWGVAKIVRANGGEVASYNGDGVLCAFAGNAKCTMAALTAMHLGWLGTQVIRPHMEQIFAGNHQLAEAQFHLGIGIDVGDVLVIRAGIRGEDNNELVWVGSPTNFAAKLAGMSTDSHWIHVFDDFYGRLNPIAKHDMNGNTIWEKVGQESSMYRCGLWMRTDVQGRAPASPSRRRLPGQPQAPNPFRR